MNLHKLLSRSTGCVVAWVLFSVAPVFAAFHSADTDLNNRISLTELTRVIELYNTKNGTVRTGAYSVNVTQPPTEDGFVADATRASTTIASLNLYHSADSDRNAKISLSEISRIIELYNYRSGTTRTGQYHDQPSSEDGFGLGPGDSKASQTITFNAIADRSFDSPLTLSATSSSSLAVTFTVVSGPAKFGPDGVTLSFFGPGPVTVRASQGGNSSYNPAPNVDRSFTATGTGGGSLASNQSIWSDVNGDGIRDEIIRAHTARYRVSITDATPDEDGLSQVLDPNDFFEYGDLTDGRQTFASFAFFWRVPQIYFSFFRSYATVTYAFEPEEGYEYLKVGKYVKPDEFGRVVDSIPTWGVEFINTLYRYTKANIHDGGSTLSIPESGQDLANFVNVSLYLIKLSKEVGSVQMSDQLGNILVANAAVGGPTADLFVPGNGQVTLQVLNAANHALGAVHDIAWEILDAVGNVIRNGTGLNVDFDALPLGALQLRVTQDSGAPKTFAVKTSRLVKRIEFVNSHGLLRSSNGTFADAGTSADIYNQRGWAEDGPNNPVSFTRGSQVMADVTIRVPASLQSSTQLVLKGYSAIMGAIDLRGTSTTTGEERVVRVTSLENQVLPPRVDAIFPTIGWSLEINTQIIATDIPPAHEVLLSWGNPVSEGLTKKRLNWVCNAVARPDGDASAAPATSLEIVADRLYDQVRKYTRFDPLVPVKSSGWALLDGLGQDPNIAGDCDDLAACMQHAFQLINSTGDGAVIWVRASNVATASSCSGPIPMTRPGPDGTTEDLLLDFTSSGDSHAWNRFEGCCRANGNLHAFGLNIKLKAADEYDMLSKMITQLGVRQFWVRTQDVNDPNSYLLVEQVSLP